MRLGGCVCVHGQARAAAAASASALRPTATAGPRHRHPVPECKWRLCLQLYASTSGENGDSWSTTPYLLGRESVVRFALPLPSARLSSIQQGADEWGGLPEPSLYCSILLFHLSFSDSRLPAARQ